MGKLIIIIISILLLTSCVNKKVPGCAKPSKNVKLTKSVTDDEIKEFTERYFKKLEKRLTKKQKKTINETEIDFEYKK
jgi:hypothetical protein